jgi:hypothetical protein
LPYGGRDAVTAYPRYSKVIQTILGKKRLFIFCGRKVMQGIFADARRGAVTQSPVREDQSTAAKAIRAYSRPPGGAKIMGFPGFIKIISHWEQVVFLKSILEKQRAKHRE